MVIDEKDRPTVYVPAPGSETTIAPSSGIVGITREDGKVLIYYEGNVYNTRDIVTFADKVAIAAGRLKEKYPTVARMVIEPANLIPVGTWDYEKEMVSVSDNRALKEWLGLDELNEGDLRTSWPSKQEMEQNKKALANPAFARILLAKAKPNPLHHCPDLNCGICHICRKEHKTKDHYRK